MDDVKSCSSSKSEAPTDLARADKKDPHKNRRRFPHDKERSHSQTHPRSLTDLPPYRRNAQEADKPKTGRRGCPRSHTQTQPRSLTDLSPYRRNAQVADPLKTGRWGSSRGMQRSYSTPRPMPLTDLSSDRRNLQETDRFRRERDYIPNSSRGGGRGRVLGQRNEPRSGQRPTGNKLVTGSRTNRVESKPKPINSQTVQTWASMEDAGHLVVLMSLGWPELEDFLNESTTQENWLEPLTKAISHAITAQHQKESVRKLLNSLCNSQFFQHLTLYFTEQQISDDSWDTAEEFVTSCIQICEEILNKLPEFANMCFTAISSLEKIAHDIKPLQENQQMLCDITAFCKKASQLFIAEKEKEKRTHCRLFTSDNSEQPPDNFLDLPVIPSESDLQEDAKPFLRRAQIEGTYDDIHHYLDVNFRLLREDFIFPLRHGIKEFKNSGCRKNFKSSDLRLYFDVKIIGSVVTEAIDHILHFNISTHKSVVSENSKHFMFGSLLCLSKDNFKTVIFATVAQSDEKNLARGIVVVNFKTGLDDVFNSTINDVYVMAETQAYFESYCHVLEGLQEMITKLPLQDYIVHCKTEVQPPRYLLPSGGVCHLPVYDLSCLMKHNSACEVPVLTTVKWPKADMMCLNESQRAAAQLALTKELAIIQGPPGTGKTYVGLKVMQVLLENKNSMAGNDENSSDPILVVCYTNHALDQFLEGVLKFCPDGIVRVGGQSKSTNLEKFNLIKLRQKLSPESFGFGSSIKMSVMRLQVQMESISDKISKLNIAVTYIQNEIANEKVLKEFMTSTHYDSLVSEKTNSQHNRKLMNTWLNTRCDTAHNFLSGMIKQHLIMLVLQFKKFQKIELSQKMNIIQRVCFYHRFLNKYENEMKMERDKMQQHRNVARAQEIRDCLEAAKTRILPDCEIKKVLFPRALEMMCKEIGDSNSLHKGNVVERWLLGLHQTLHSQLDDVEMLADFSKDNARSARSQTDYSFNKMQNDRRVDVDDDRDDKFNASIRAALNNTMSLTQRAEMLGIIDKSVEENDPDETEFQTVSRAKRFSVKAVLKKLTLIEPMTEEQEASINDVWELKLNERFALYNLWVQRYKKSLTENMQILADSYKSVQERKKEARSEETLFVLRKAKVIGMTTSGAARHRSVLQALGCRIIVVEEAAEVLESHIVTSLNENCKHLVLIGDHQQLRPNPTVYQLAKDFGLEISLFERLIKNKVPHVMLKEQHRMRPEISEIMRHIYPDLQDHPSVSHHEKIRGVSKNIFFIQHEHKETHLDDTMSKANTHEAKLLVALCQYLLNQDYRPSQITILATYSGQVSEIRKVMREQHLDLTLLVTAVDNYQGEENDIILLSLVRSNTENKVGFLKVDNRVCVALSRAKKGLYVIGNFNLLASQSELWDKIIKTANVEHIIDMGLPVMCENHLDFQEVMISNSDFKKCPEGGCGRPCEYRLSCGHICRLVCHGYDAKHVEYKCQKLCNRNCKDGHLCRKQCFMDCGECSELVVKKIPRCGHEDQVPCFVPAEDAICTQKCPCILDCQHQCSGLCGECDRTRRHAKCDVPKWYQWPCGHSAEVPCHSYPPSYPCTYVCGATLQCGHKCKGSCLDCLDGAVHVACGEKCNQQLPCGHMCARFCSTPCLPCTVVCPSQCRHGECFRLDPTPRCSHACLPCEEKCLHRCKHFTCRKRCSEDCDIKSCNKKCYRTVPNCHHQCSGLCGELCVCKKCDKVHKISGISNKSRIAKDSSRITQQIPTDAITAETDAGQKIEANKGTRKHEKYGEKNVRLLLRIPTCNHVFYVDDLDEYISGFDLNGCSYLLCPACQSPILKCLRYENINKERSRRRAQEKIKLEMKTRISDKQKRDLLMSKKILDDSFQMREFQSLDVKSVSNLVELNAVAFQIKCAFVMDEIYTTLVILCDANFKKLYAARMKMLLQIKDRLTNQQKDEFTVELSRCFWLSYLSYLHKFVESSEGSKEMHTEIKVILDELSKPKPDKNILDTAAMMFHLRNKQIQESCDDSLEKARLTKMEQISLDVTKILQSGDEMLCNLIGTSKKS